MKKAIYAAAAVFFGVNVSYAGETALDSLRGAVSPSTLSGTVLPASPVATPVPAGSWPAGSGAVPSSELVNFWENLDGGKIGLDDTKCKSAQLNLNENGTVVNVLGIGGGFRRQLKVLPDNRLLLLDEVDVNLSATIGVNVLPIANVGAVSVAVSGGVEGKSIVVRPLEDAGYCRGKASLAKLYQMKTVLPINAKRIGEMENGEIWKLPVVVRYSISGGAGVTAGQVVTVSVGAGIEKARKPSVSLYKIDDNNLRVRLRLDHVTVKSVGVSANTVEIPIGYVGQVAGDNLFSQVADWGLAREINSIIAFKLGYNYAHISGQKLLLEFNIDPKTRSRWNSLPSSCRAILTVSGNSSLWG